VEQKIDSSIELSAMDGDINSNDFEAISNSFPEVIYGEELNQGHGMWLGDRIKLAALEMMQLKEIIDKEINSALSIVAGQYFNVEASCISNLCLPADNKKLSNISVIVEELDGRILVKVGPCDLSGVGSHDTREQIIKNLVNQALKAKKLDALEHTFENVNVSACVGVRGLLQVALGLFSNNRESPATHMNAYVKTSHDKGLTHWEPRQGPQRWHNDTICAMVTSVATSIFEQGIRRNTIKSAAQATTEILKSELLIKMFDDLLAKTKDRITDLVVSVKSFVGVESSHSSSNSL
jgi:hypothetical protein